MHGNGHSYSYKLKELQFFSTVNSYRSNFVTVRRLFFIVKPSGKHLLIDKIRNSEHLYMKLITIYNLTILRIYLFENRLTELNFFTSQS